MRQSEFLNAIGATHQQCAFGALCDRINPATGTQWKLGKTVAVIVAHKDFTGEADKNQK